MSEENQDSVSSKPPYNAWLNRTIIHYTTLNRSLKDLKKIYNNEPFDDPEALEALLYCIESIESEMSYVKNKLIETYREDDNE